jgi:hypothetical protein
MPRQTVTDVAQRVGAQSGHGDPVLPIRRAFQGKAVFLDRGVRPDMVWYRRTIFVDRDHVANTACIFGCSRTNDE